MCGACGRMGRLMSAGIMAAPDMEIVSAVDIIGNGHDVGVLAGGEPTGLPVKADLLSSIHTDKPDVLVDFTNPQSVMKNLRIVLPYSVPCVVGTTGFTEPELKEVGELATQYQTAVLYAPNFALGAVLMMDFAKTAARYFPHVEIIERHHDQKLDAPSGTALATLDLIAKERDEFVQGAANEQEKIAGARGGCFQGARVHSVRLPGYVASQEVVFGATGQLLTIRHDAMSRDCFLPGLLLAIRKISQLKGLVVGLEKII
ncbi:MAG: 4-hydroxy-tetrahydrodipicolinate reductase [Clostridiales bacterium]|nr:4-hydroxy-tetrahydrodipicolinate reductase [Clostridiales bacterium]